MGKEKPKLGISGLNLAPGCLLIPLTDLFPIFSPWGYTLENFRTFLLALGVVPITTPSGIELIHYFKFLVAIEMATHLSTRDTPKRKYPPPPEELLSHLSANWKDCLTFMLAARKHQDFATYDELKATLEEAADLLADNVVRRHRLKANRTAFHLQRDTFNLVSSDDGRATELIREDPRTLPTIKPCPAPSPNPASTVSLPNSLRSPPSTTSADSEPPSSSPSSTAKNS